MCPDEKEKSLYDILVNKGVLVGDLDHGKVCLLVNLTLEDQGKKELERMKYLSEKYGQKDFVVLG